MHLEELELSQVDLCGKRLLIFVVAYNAETTIQKVLSRIPASLHSQDVEVLIIDDSSKDGTFAAGLRYQQRHSAFKITVLRTPENQGYGGNQKLGYRYAIDNGFDIVALIHGDGQYAPEKLPALLRPLIRNEADAVLGSRMIDKRAARRGGMPFLQMDRQSNPDRVSKPDARHRPFGISLRLSPLCHKSAGANSVRKEHERFPFRYRDHHSVRAEKTADCRAADPDVLRRRNLLREWIEIRLEYFQSDYPGAALRPVSFLRSEVRCETRRRNLRS